MANVDTQIAAAQAYAASIKTTADAAFSTMRSDIANIGFITVVTTDPVLPNEPDDPVLLTAPTLAPVNLELPEEPGSAPVFQPIQPIEPGDAPEFGVTAPELTEPILPAEVAAFVDSAPAITTEFDFPTIPAALENPYIDAPNLVDRDEPEAPIVALPSFDAIKPVDNMTPPADLSTQFINAYNDVQPAMVSALRGHMETWLSTYNPQFHTQLARIEAQLATYLAGGTGLDAAVETAIYERAKDKDIAEARRTSRAAYANAAARGFTIPDGAAFSQDARARQAASDNLARSANEIAIKQAETEQANLQFAVTTSAALRNSMLSASLSYHGSLISINGQALDYAKSILGSIVQVYNLTVTAFQARLDAYRADAQVFDTRMRAALASVEVYKARIDALQALTNVDRARVDVYRARIDALNTYAQIYRTQVQTVVERASLEKLKVDLFRTRVDAFVATVQGKKAEYDGYAAALSGQEARMRVFGAQVAAHSAEVTSFRAKIEAKAAVVDATAKTNQALALQYKSELDGYSTVVEARGKKAAIEIDVQRALINAFEAEVKASMGNVSMQVDVFKAKAEIILKKALANIEGQIRNADMVLGRTRVVAEMGAAQAQVYQGMAGAALSGMNTLVSQSLAE